MKNLISKIYKFHEAISSIKLDEVYHYDASGCKSNRYIVWAEETQGNSNYLNNNLEEQVITGTIDFFTKKEFDKLADDIQKTFAYHGISFSLFAIQYETITGYIHYTWNWEIS